MHQALWRTALNLVVLVVVLGPERGWAAKPRYSVEVVDIGANREYRLFQRDFHFASVIVTDVGISNGFVLRPHPDRDAPDGWGSSLFVAPFLVGADSGNVQVHHVRRTNNGIRIFGAGELTAPSGATFGVWFWTILLRYDDATETIASSDGALGIWLEDPLDIVDRDLNLFRLSSNYLYNVPLQSGGVGDTGDIKEVIYQYAPEPDPRDFVWVPPLLPAHFPFDLTDFLSVNAVGTVNDVDTLALGEGFQINVAPKPSLEVTLAALEPGYEMIAGMIWNESEGMNFAADNVGVTPLIPKGTTDETLLLFAVDIRSSPPTD
jgi:hypothetical protein